jgi:conjugal transfer pilus assembly protein TraB
MAEQKITITDAATAIRRSQNLRLYGVVAVMSVVIITLVVMLVNGPSLATAPKTAVSYKPPITSGASRLDPKEMWAEKFATEHDLQARRLEAMEKMLQALIKINEQALPVGSSGHYSANDTNHGRQISAQPLNLHARNGQTVAQNIGDVLAATADLREDVRTTYTSTDSSAPFDVVGKQLSGGTTSTGGATPQNTRPKTVQSPPPVQPPRFRSKGIQRTSLMLANSKSNKNLKTVDNTIPAGAFAGAVMVGGVDASTSIQASNDPRPVLLRVTDHGTVPRKFKSDLCGCHVLAACYGDISSERVYMRLEKLTCTERKTGEVVEMTVNGYVAGEDGRAGLRGIVVDRAGESMRNAAIGGFLSGMGNFLSQSHNPVTFSPANGLAQTNPMTNPEMLKFGAAKGASGALDKYAEFYIKRAEQMQPVIQVQAGRMVDIVFTQGVAFENSAARGEMIKVNDQQRLSQLHSSSDTTQKPVEAWIPSSQERGQGK